MRVIARSRQDSQNRNLRSANSQNNGLHLLLPETSRWEDLAANLVAWLSSLGARPGYTRHPVFTVIQQPPWKPQRSMLASTVCHVAFAALLLNLTALWRFAGPSKSPQQIALANHRIEWYRTAD